MTGRKQRFNTMAAMSSPGTALAERRPAEGVQTVAVTLLNPLPGQPRRTFPEEALAELAQSIREKGVVTPLLLRHDENGTYQIVAGERRYRAAQRAGLTALPAVVRHLTLDEALELAFIENAQREDLNALDDTEARLELLARAWDRTPDEARATLYAMRKDPALHPELRTTGQALFDRLGRPLKLDSFTGNRLPLLNLSDLLKAAVREGLDFQQVREVARAPEKHHSQLLDQVRAGIGRRELKAAVTALQPAPKPAPAADYASLTRDLNAQRIQRLPEARRAQVTRLLQQIQKLMTE
jgi:ParB family chromosome partitioning protein